MRDLFREDSDRFQRFSVTFEDLLLDYSKNRITPDTMQLLAALATETKLERAIEEMFSGAKINITEQRPALHTALRNRANRPVYVDGDDIMPKINAVLERMRSFSDAVRQGQRRGYTNKAITDIVNIGIGGSDLGPRVAVEALRPYSQSTLRVHHVANVDGTEIDTTLQDVNPETTLFIISSKTFTTQETLTNAQTAKDWFFQHISDKAAFAKHFVAVSANTQAAKAFGIDKECIFEIWDWVGGRYSLWSAIGLSVALCIGMDHFEELLAGAFAMDEHFRTQPFDKNIPVILALLGIWYNNFFGVHTHAVLPYDHSLRLLPACIQQLDMESNGKSVSRDGKTLEYATGPILWGAPGTNGQHAFFQYLHQGTQFVPADFLAPLISHHPIGEHHTILLANCFAQTEALMRGRSEDEVHESENQGQAAAKIVAGNKPSNTLLFTKLTPRVLGSLLAMYEHKVFAQGIVWNVNSFDQWGVELGKQLASGILKEIQDAGSTGPHDTSTKGLIAHYKRTVGPV